jgi:hypothetical protein
MRERSVDDIGYALSWLVVGLLCVFAGSEPAPMKGRYRSVRSVYFPDEAGADMGAKPAGASNDGGEKP